MDNSTSKSDKNMEDLTEKSGKKVDYFALK